MLVHLGLAAIVPAMVCALSIGVLPNLAREGRESPASRPLHAWIDLWLPLLVALPLAATALSPLSSELSPALLLVLLVGAPVALAGAVSGVALLDRRGFTHDRVLDGPHFFACAVLGLVLLSAAYVARLPDWIGHLLLTAAILWLWTVSGDAPHSGRADSRGSAFFVDWTGPLAHPVAPGWKALIAAALLLGAIALALGHALPAASFGKARIPPPLLPAAVALLALAGQAAALLGVCRSVGPRAGLRASVSTMLLSALLGLGLLCTRLIPWSAMIRSRGRLAEVDYQPLDLTGLTALGPAGLLVAALALPGLAPWLHPLARRVLGWCLIAAAALCLASALLLTRSAWPASEPPAAPAPPPSLEEPTGRSFRGGDEQFCIGA